MGGVHIARQYCNVKHIHIKVTMVHNKEISATLVRVLMYHDLYISKQ